MPSASPIHNATDYIHYAHPLSMPSIPETHATLYIHPNNTPIIHHSTNHTSTATDYIHHRANQIAHAHPSFDIPAPASIARFFERPDRPVGGIGRFFSRLFEAFA